MSISEDGIRMQVTCLTCGSGKLIPLGRHLPADLEEKASIARQAPCLQCSSRAARVSVQFGALWTLERSVPHGEAIAGIH